MKSLFTRYYKKDTHRTTSADKNLAWTMLTTSLCSANIWNIFYWLSKHFNKKLEISSQKC